MICITGFQRCNCYLDFCVTALKGGITGFQRWNCYLDFLRYCTERWNCLPLIVGEKCNHFLEDQIASSYCKVSSSVSLCVFVRFLS